MYNNIFFSIIICCYNSENYLSETLDSIINQKYPNWELILINDGSIDKTEEIIYHYINQCNKIKYYKQENKGFAHSRNIAIKKSKGNWIVIIDHDDICMIDRLNIHYEQIIEDKKNSKLFFGDTIHFGKDIHHEIKHLDKFNMNNINLNKIEVSKSLLADGCFIDSESVMFEKKAAIKIGGFNPKYKYVADYDFFIRMGLKYNFSFTKKILSKWRVHNSQASKSMKIINQKELINLYYQYLFINDFNKNYLFRLSIILKLLKLLIKKYL
tara:strand:- start:707 stop:1513 length:807 start_codon:yes stop_codon:yes gene_type:complete